MLATLKASRRERHYVFNDDDESEGEDDMEIYASLPVSNDSSAHAVPAEGTTPPDATTTTSLQAHETAALQLPSPSAATASAGDEAHYRSSTAADTPQPEAAAPHAGPERRSLRERCREAYFRPGKAAMVRAASYAAQAGIAEADADFASIIMQAAADTDDAALADIITRSPPWATTNELIAALREGMPEYANGVCPICGDIVALYAGSYLMPPPCGHKLLCASCAQNLGEQYGKHPELGVPFREALCPWCK